MNIRDYLEKKDLQQYIELFEKNDVTFDVLKILTDEDLKELGIESLGHRKKLLGDIQEFKNRAVKEQVERGNQSWGMFFFWMVFVVADVVWMIDVTSSGLMDASLFMTGLISFMVSSLLAYRAYPAKGGLSALDRFRFWMISLVRPGLRGELEEMKEEILNGNAKNFLEAVKIVQNRQTAHPDKDG